MALISHVLFPIMCFDEQDKELWEDDPHEFVRKTFDIMEDYMRLKAYQYCRIDGNTGGAEREQQMDDYNAPGSEKFT